MALLRIICEFDLLLHADGATVETLACLNASFLARVARYWLARWSARAGLSLRLLLAHNGVHALSTPKGRMWHVQFSARAREQHRWWNNRQAHLFHAHASRYLGRPATADTGDLCARQGHVYDVRDKRGFWSGAVVLNRSHSSIRVRFLGWSSRFNECIEVNDWNARSAPFGRRSLQWTGAAPVVRPGQYALVHRRQLLCAVDPSLVLESAREPYLCGYTTAEIIDVYTGHYTSDKSLIKIRVWVDEMARGTKRAGTTCLMHVRPADVLPMNDITVVIFQSKHLLEENFLGAGAPAEDRALFLGGLAAAEREFAAFKHRENRCPCCAQFKARLEDIGAYRQSWIKPRRI